jgi:D-alanine-D-alanine ligase
MRLNVAVVSGGDSGEFDISIQSGFVVNKFLDPNKYKVYPIIIKGQEWVHDGPINNIYAVDKNDFSVMIGEIKINFDCVFIAIHGTPGEDGKLQGYFDMLGIPYTSCDQVTSSLTFNKYFCKIFVSNFKVKTARSLLLIKSININSDEILTQLTLPLFVKPNNGGSSVGMSKITLAEELNQAIDRAFKEDNEVLLEEYIEGREITCGVLKHKGKLIKLPVTEIISKKDFFNFEAKYDPSLADEIVPAQIPQEIFTNCQETSAKLYEKLNCKGVVRFDYIYNEKGMYFLEVNTIPGLTEASLIPKMAENYGMTLTELFGILVEEAMR